MGVKNSTVVRNLQKSSYTFFFLIPVRVFSRICPLFSFSGLSWGVVSCFNLNSTLFWVLLKIYGWKIHSSSYPRITEFKKYIYLNMIQPNIGDNHFKGCQIKTFMLNLGPHWVFIASSAQVPAKHNDLATLFSFLLWLLSSTGRIFTIVWIE